MSFLNEVHEGFYAGIVRALILFAKGVHPAVREWWENSQWSKLVTAGACLLTAAVLWVLTCPLGWLDIPIYKPGCDPQGVLIDVLYKAFLAYMLNWGGESAFRWARDKVKNRVSLTILTWFGSFAFWVFIGTVVIEFLLSVSGIGLWTGFFISAAVSLLATLMGKFLFTMAWAIRSQALMRFGDILWLAAMVAKILIHFAPIPFYLKPLLSVGLTAIVFFLANFVFGRRS